MESIKNGGKSIINGFDRLPKASNIESYDNAIAELKNKVKELNNEKTYIFFKDVEKIDEYSSILKAVFGNSPYLTHICLSNPEFLQDILTRNPNEIYDSLIGGIKDYNNFDGEEEIYQFLRITKRKLALLIAIMDIKLTWSLAEVTKKLTVFADLAVEKTCELLLLRNHYQKIIKLKNPERPLDNSGLIVLALGKMGASELNYSSDIDLAVFYDETKLEYLGRKSIGQFFIGIAQELTDILSKRTMDGYVFRVDMRLRPDPASNPIAVGLAKAEHYYQTVGQNWERAAFIKCNFIAGDKDTARKFLNFMENHVYRRELDFETIEDIHSIKRQINTKQGISDKEQDIDFYGYNVKIGKGGIREIEFYAQTQQLIWGGRRTRLKEKQTCNALKALYEEREISELARDELVSAYEFFRYLEHRLQMVNDEQTHSLPKNEEDMQNIAIFCGFDNKNDFFEALKKHVSNVRKHYVKLFEASPTLASEMAGGSLIFTGTENHPDTLQTLKDLGFSNPDMISDVIRGWHHGRIEATTRKQARAELTKLLPIMLAHFAKSFNPDDAFTNFDLFLSHQPQDSKIFALLYQNPKIMKLMTEIMSGYPQMAENLKNNPALLYYVITPEFNDTQPEIDELRLSLKIEMARVSEEGTINDTIEEIKEWAQDRVFRNGIRYINKLISTEDLFANLSDIAEIVITEMTYLAISEAKRKINEDEDSSNVGEFCILAFGKLGNRELSFGSDLDVVFIYNVNERANDNLERAGTSAQQFYTKIANRIVGFMGGSSKYGSIYNLDMRLRPNGDAGNIATNFASLDQYYDQTKREGTAWIWEYMALTRARPLGNCKLSTKLNELVSKKLKYKWDEDSLRKDVLYIHNKLKSAKRTNDIFHVKHVDGGLVDLEYIVQYLQLKHAYEKPDILSGNLEKSLASLGENNIISNNEVVTLINSLKLYQKVQNILRLTKEKNFDDAIGNIICKFTGFKNIEELKSELGEKQKEVKVLFVKYIGNY